MLFNLSLRYKLPLLGAVLILTTALVLSASFLAQAWGNLRQDMLKIIEHLAVAASVEAKVAEETNTAFIGRHSSRPASATRKSR